MATKLPRWGSTPLNDAVAQTCVLFEPSNREFNSIRQMNANGNQFNSAKRENWGAGSSLRWLRYTCRWAFVVQIYRQWQALLMCKWLLCCVRERLTASIRSTWMKRNFFSAKRLSNQSRPCRRNWTLEDRINFRASARTQVGSNSATVSLIDSRLSIERGLKIEIQYCTVLYSIFASFNKKSAEGLKMSGTSKTRSPLQETRFDPFISFN